MTVIWRLITDHSAGKKSLKALNFLHVQLKLIRASTLVNQISLRFQIIMIHWSMLTQWKGRFSTTHSRSKHMKSLVRPCVITARAKQQSDAALRSSPSDSDPLRHASRLLSDISVIGWLYSLFPYALNAIIPTATGVVGGIRVYLRPCFHEDNTVKQEA